MSASVTNTRIKNGKYYICVAISLCLIFLFGKVVPPFAGITSVGIGILGVFFGVLFAILATNEIFWPSLMGLAGIVLCGYLPAKSLLSTWFGNSTIQQIIWVMALTGAVSESGAINVLSKKMLHLKFLEGHPMRLFSAILIAVLGCTFIVGSPATVLLLFYPLLDSILSMCSIDPDSELNRQFSLGMYLCTPVGVVLPFKGVHLSTLAIVSGIMATYGLTLNNGLYLIITSLIIVLTLVLYLFFVKFVWRTDLTPLKSFNVSKMGITEDDLKFTSKQKLLLGFLLFGVVFLLLDAFLPSDSAFVSFSSKIGSSLIWIILFGVLCFLRDKDGKPVINGVKLLQSKTMWNIVAVAGCFTICGSAIASKELGISNAIFTGLAPVLEHINWPALVILTVLLSTIMTNFTSGLPITTLVVTIGTPIVCTMQLAGRGNVTVLAAFTILSGMFAFLTYGSIACASILLGRKGMTTKFMFTKGFLMMIVFIVICCAVCIPAGYLFS